MEPTLKKVRIVTMSDTHDMHHKIPIDKLPPGDIFIHGGDFTKISSGPEHARFIQFLKMLPYKHKIVIAGNHDYGLDKVRYEASLKKKHESFMVDPVNPDEEIKKLK